MITRDKTRVVNIGGVRVGGGHPIVVQSMTNTDTRDVAATVAQINALHAAGCEIARIAVPNIEAAAAIRDIKDQISIPLVADIHFDYKLAIESVKNGADKLRINPGNIGSDSRVREVAEAAKANGLPIRVGVNGGSLEKDILQKYGGVTAEGLAES
ncbi:MAG: flavodoxin-dependent (E)-4-hydroxy-3-methylbut-2-enyl-diphosphate synthase, partial [Defluviitaleaceae bacterium]|nr:flavodoxin-dependent (E)-4-hydroxy-3-methylbut-2-enyl-diphosphate synthase [Defluviitaleaceae bacterium]